MDVWTEIEGQRRNIVSMLEGLSDEQWDAETLCPEWKVRHVVAHMTPSNIKMGGFLLGVIASGFNFNKALAKDAIKAGSAEPAELLKRFQNDITSRKKPPVATLNVLVDNVVHTQDIRRPLGLGSDVPTDRLITVADQLKGLSVGMGTKKRIAGLKLQATDGDWTHGDGPEVKGTLEALVMVMAGRTAAIDDLSGEGVDTLRSRG